MCVGGHGSPIRVGLSRGGGLGSGIVEGEGWSGVKFKGCGWGVRRRRSPIRVGGVGWSIGRECGGGGKAGVRVFVRDWMQRWPKYAQIAPIRV